MTEFRLWFVCFMFNAVIMIYILFGSISQL